MSPKDAGKAILEESAHPAKKLLGKMLVKAGLYEEAASIVLFKLKVEMRVKCYACVMKIINLSYFHDTRKEV